MSSFILFVDEKWMDLDAQTYNMVYGRTLPMAMFKRAYICYAWIKLHVIYLYMPSIIQIA